MPKLAVAAMTKFNIDEWEATDGVQADYTTIATSNQNGPAERSIQTAENSMRAMLKAQELPLEFWDEAVEADAYIRNRQPTGPIIKGKICNGWCRSDRDSTIVQ